MVMWDWKGSDQFQAYSTFGPFEVFGILFPGKIAPASYCPIGKHLPSLKRGSEALKK